MLSNHTPQTPPFQQAAAPLAGRIDLSESDWSPVEPFDTPPAGGEKVRSADRLDNRGVSLHPSHPSAPQRAQKTKGKGTAVRAEDFAQYADLHRARGLFRSVGARSVACCGLGTATGTADLVRAWKEGIPTAWTVGVSRCASPWLCPACGPVIAARRANDLAPQLSALRAAGWSVWLATLTVRHDKGDDVAALFGMLGKAWGRMTQGKAWDKRRAAYGGAEYVRGYDWTFSRRHGAHPHLHAVLCFGPGAGDGRAAAADVLARWASCLRAVGGQALPRALDIQPARDPEAAAAYAMSLAGVSKRADRSASVPTGKAAKAAMRVGFETVAEATAAASKRGRAAGGLTAADLRDAALGGDAWAFQMFAAYAQATKGKRAVVVSQGLRLKPEAEAREEDAETVEPEVVAVLRQKGLVALDPHLPRALAASAAGVSKGRALLAQVLGPPGRDGLWDVPLSDQAQADRFGDVAERVARFGPIGASASALLAQLAEQHRAVRARLKAERAAFKARRAARGKK